MVSARPQTDRKARTGLAGRALLALLLAFGFWAWVTSNRDPDSKVVFDNVPVTPINTPEGLIATAPDPPAVALAVWGPRSVVSGLQAGNFTVAADLKEIKPGIQRVPLRVNTTTNNIRKTETTPAAVQLNVERSVERTVPVAIPSQTAPGVKVNSIIASPAEVRIAGPESRVKAVAQVIADFTLGDRSASYSQPVEVKPVDASGNAVAGITATPARVTITADITDLRNERTVPVTIPDYTGTPAPGFQLDGFAPTPAQVTLTGDPQVLRTITSVPTEPFSIDGLRQTTTVTTRLQAGKLPAGITFKDPAPEIRVQVNISEITSTVQLLVTIQPINLKTGLQPTLAQRDATVTLRGTRAQLTQIGTNLVAFVNLAAYTGPTTADVKVEVPLPADSKVTIEKIAPPTIAVTISAIPTPTPIPPTATPRPIATPTTAATPTP